MLTRLDPFFSTAFTNSLFNDPVLRSLGAPARADRDDAAHFSPPVEVHDSDDQLVLHAELPGFKQEDVELELEDHVLTLRATRVRAERKEEHGRVLTERRYGTFTRSFKLPPVVDEEAVEATMEDGVLTVAFKKRAEARSRKIEVGATKPRLEAAA